MRPKIRQLGQSSGLEEAPEKKDSPAINCHRKTLLLVSHKTSDEQDKWRATVCNLL